MKTICRFVVNCNSHLYGKVFIRLPRFYADRSQPSRTVKIIDPGQQPAGGNSHHLIDPVRHNPLSEFDETVVRAV